MNERSPGRRFASRPGDPEDWIRAPERRPKRDTAGNVFAARLTIDVTPELRGRIKVVAFRRGETVTDMLRELLEREFPASEGDAP